MVDRRAQIRGEASGRMLEVVSGTFEADAGEYDTVVGIDVLASIGDPDAYIRRVENLLGPEGRFGFVERDHDFAAVVRRNGLFVTDLWRLGRTEVAGWARRPS